MKTKTTRRDFLTNVLTSGVMLAGHSSWASLLVGCAGASKPSRLNHLQSTLDVTTGLPLLELPPGFRYFSFGWKDEMLSSGDLMPGAADGMGMVSQQGQKITLVRNHEIWADVGQFTNKVNVYDPGAGGGTVVMEVDLQQQKLLSARPGLVGTTANCSGGLLPDGRWLSCEELVHVPGVETKNFDGSIATRFNKPHGFVFEGGPIASVEPLVAMGQFRHEGVCMDPATGIIYLTEDHKPAGFYRFTPKDPMQLQRGGLLEVMQVVGIDDLRFSSVTKKKYRVRWLRIDNPLKAHTPDTNDQGGVITQGINAGATLFTRLEGIYFRAGQIYFNSTDGGPSEAGQVFVYRPANEELELVYASPSISVMDYPDQMCQGPESGTFIAQDSKRVEQQVMWWLAPDATPHVFAKNTVNIKGKSYLNAEWSGLCMSEDKQWLFANIYSPGFTVAITGPWQQWSAGL